MTTIDEQLVFNGINGATGGYLLPKLTVHDIARIAQGEPLDKEYLNDLKYRHQQATEKVLRIKEDVDPHKLSEAGWGIIFAYSDSDKVDAIKEALGELLRLRRQQAGELYKEYVGVNAYRSGESKDEFLRRHGAGPGPVNPTKVPYYLLIVGNPEAIPYRFQYQLAVQYAVGRIDFETMEEYVRYAHSVVEAEQGNIVRPRRAAFFGVQNPADAATSLSARHLIEPLAKIAANYRGWSVQTILAEQATKSRLVELVGGNDTPALLFTASHGVGFPKGDPRQRRHQGALLCQDWPGPLQWPEGQPIPEEHYLSCDDIPDDARVGGLLTFHFACYGAGTPALDDFAYQAFKKAVDITPHAFVACLPQRLLSHPQGGALAVIGHVDRAWRWSFLWGRAGQQLETFESTLKRLLKGYPVGLAMEYFGERHAEVATMLSDVIKYIRYGKEPDDAELADLWTANNDARNYVIVGDPAVRLPVKAVGE